MERQHDIVNLAPKTVAIAAIHPRSDIDREEQVRQRIAEDQAGGRVNDIQVKQQVGQRRGHEHHARNGKLIVEHGAEVAQPLLEGQPAPEQRIIEAENLRHTARPAGTLDHVEYQTLRCQPRRQRNIDKRRFPAATLHFQRGVRIFCHRLNGKTANLFQRATADHRTRAAEEGGVPVIITLLDWTVKQHPFVGDITPHRQVTFKGVRRIEVVRRLHQRQHGIFQEPANGGLKKNTRRHVVAVKYANQLTLGDFHRVVEVTCFGVVMLGTGNIPDAHVLSENGKFPTAAVIEKIDFYFISWIINTLSCQHRVTHHFQRFVIGRNINIHRRP